MTKNFLLNIFSNKFKKLNKSIESNKYIDKYVTKYFIFIYILCILIYPILFLVNKVINNYYLTILDINLKNISYGMDNYELFLKTNNKLFWHEFFNENNIKTPKIYYYKKEHKLIKLNNLKNKKKFIMKPINGTFGLGIKKITFDNFKKINNTNIILQEYIRDCYTNKSRDFRAITFCTNNNTTLFYLYERKRFDDKIATNIKGYKRTICKDNKCSFLSKKENNELNEIISKLKKLHKKNLYYFPFIGWDISLTCKGPYVFEGNTIPTLYFPKLYTKVKNTKY